MIPHVILGVVVRNHLKPEFLNFAKTWTANITSEGFHACIHENFIISGQHEVTMVSNMILETLDHKPLACPMFSY